ncbi:clathrin assembly protein, partial [Trifolium pratense]
ARQQPHDVSNHANGTTGWELTLVTARSSNESAEATSKLIGFEEDYFGVSDKVGCEGFNDSASK